MNMEFPLSFDIETDESVIRAELERVLAEKRFSGAPQMTAFLSYIVNQTLVGHADRIKAFSIGVDALGKPDSFDAQSDPSVRVLALRLRKTLGSLYENPGECKAIIALRVGTYVPKFYQAPSESQNVELMEDDESTASFVTSIGRLSVARSSDDLPQSAVLTDVNRDTSKLCN
jgi:hypothetical protein